MRAILILISILILAGCANLKPQPPGKTTASPIDLRDTSLVKERLLSQYSQWKGTPFEYGGSSKEGVDCSAFVQIAFHSGLGLQLPRTTTQQVKRGVMIYRDQLRTGDLVFFKTGVADRHVGVYLEDSLFIHASKSKGVIISSLKNNYWTSNYWVSRRILPKVKHTAGL